MLPPLPSLLSRPDGAADAAAAELVTTAEAGAAGRRALLADLDEETAELEVAVAETGPFVAVDAGPVAPAVEVAAGAPVVPD